MQCELLCDTTKNFNVFRSATIAPLNIILQFKYGEGIEINEFIRISQISCTSVLKLKNKKKNKEKKYIEIILRR